MIFSASSFLPLKQRTGKFIPKPRRAKGFTLLELLLTLTIFSVIMTFVVNSFLQFKQQSKRVESILELRREVRNIEKLLRDDLQSTIYLHEYVDGNSGYGFEKRRSGVYGEDDFLEDKDADRLHLHVNLPSKFYYSLPLFRDPEIHEVSYYLEEKDDKIKFKRREEFYIDQDITEGERSVVHTLSENVTSFDVKYYRKSPIGNENQEEEEWDSAGQPQNSPKLPIGIKISMEITAKSGETVKSEIQVNLQPDMGKSVEWPK